jgi:hypothetical protein
VESGQRQGTWHDLRSVRGVPLRSLAIIVLSFCALPVTASPQPWADAYKAGDYNRAAKLLLPLVLDFERLIDSANPAPARRLALLYAQGRGVPRDPIAACSLARLANMATQNEAPQFGNNIAGWNAHIEASEQFVHEQCDGLSHEDFLAASRSVGCYAFGMPEQVLTVGGQSVRVGKGGIRMADEPFPEGSAPDFGCPQTVARIRPLTIAPPLDAAPDVRARHFIELISWGLGGDRRAGTRTYSLQWQVFEVRGSQIHFLPAERLRSSGTWPEPIPELPSDFDAHFTMEMIRSGHVRWKLDGAPPKRGWLMLPEEIRR